MSKNNFKAFDYDEVKKHQEKYKEETEKLEKVLDRPFVAVL